MLWLGATRLRRHQGSIVDHISDNQVAIELRSQQESRNLATAVGNLYRDVFSLPPFLGTEDEFRDQRSYYEEILLRRGFQLVTAKYADQYIGFIYGYLLPRDTKWWNGLSEELSDVFIEETGSRTFVIIDFGVLPAYRGKGVGKALHHCILSASGARRATLTVQAKAADTRSIYEHWGWRRIGQKSGSLGEVPVTFSVYVLAIAD